MKYTNQAIKYTARNILYILPLVILPALLLSFSLDRLAINAVLETVFAGNLQDWTFPQVFRAVSIFNFGSWRIVLFGFFGVVLLVLFVAILMAFLEKHMRIGKRTMSGVFSKLNDNLLSTFSYALLLLGIYEFWSLITAALLFFTSRIDAAIISYVLSGAVFVIMHVVLLYLVGLIYLWLPCMQITGFRAMEALYYSNQISSPAKGQILAGQLFVLLFVEALIGVCALLASSALIFYVCTTALYSAMIAVYCVRMQIAYFDLDHIERADLRRYYR